MSNTDFSILNPDLSLFSYLLFLKGAIVVGIVLYLIFSIVIVRQVFLLSTTLKTGVSPVLKIVALLNLMAIFGLLYLALFYV